MEDGESSIHPPSAEQRPVVHMKPFDDGLGSLIDHFCHTLLNVSH